MTRAQTHTMLGTAEDAGIIPRAVQQLYADAAALEAAQGWAFDMKARMHGFLLRSHPEINCMELGLEGRVSADRLNKGPSKQGVAL